MCKAGRRRRRQGRQAAAAGGGKGGATPRSLPWLTRLPVLRQADHAVAAAPQLPLQLIHFLQAPLEAQIDGMAL